MPKRSRKPRQEDENTVAYDVVRAATEADEAQAEPTPPAKNPAAVALGRQGGLKGGKARAAKLTSEQRKAIAKKAAAKRWGRPEDRP